jgi:hypothetical protein
LTATVTAKSTTAEELNQPVWLELPQALRLAALFVLPSYQSYGLKDESSRPRTLSESSHTSLVLFIAAIKNDLSNAFSFCSFSNQGTNRHSNFNFGLLISRLEFAIIRGSQGATRCIINDLRRNMRESSKDSQSWPFRAPTYPCAHPLDATVYAFLFTLLNRHKT